MKRKISVYNILIAVLAVIMCVSLFMLVRGIVVGKKEQNDFEELSNLVIIAPAEKTEEPEQGNENIETVRDISTVLRANSECVGWIYVEGTIINYPVMHTPNDPEKYLHLNFQAKYSYSGTPFLDARCDENSENTILYGHNMKNGTMFNQLRWYRSLQHMRDYPVIEYQTADKVHKFTVFAAAQIAPNDKWYSFIEADTQEAYNSRIKYLKSIDLYESGITPTYPQKLITLSTCSGDGRFIVVGYESE